MTTPVMNPAETMVGTSNGVGLWVAPAGTAAPSTPGAAFTTPWLPLGYASDDGVTIGGDQTTEAFTPWQSRTPIRTVITEKTRTIGFTMWQLNQTTLGVYFDQAITGSGQSFDFEVRSDAPQVIRAVAVDALDGQRSLRIVYPRATLESTGDMTLTKGAMVPLEVTLNALDTDGVLCHIYVGGGASGAMAELSAEDQQDSEAGAEPVTADAGR